MKPGAAPGRRSARRTTKEGLRELVEGPVRTEPEDVRDLFGLERVQEARRREAGIGPQPDAGDEGLQPPKKGKHEVEPAGCGVHVAGAKPSPEEEAPEHAGHDGVVAARPVVAVPGASGLMAMDLVGERVQVEGDLLAVRAQERRHQLAKNDPESAAVLLGSEGAHELRKRRLRAEALRSVAPGLAERAVAPPPGDGQTKGRIVPEERDIVLVSPPLRQRQDPGPHEFKEGMPRASRITRVRQVPTDQRGQPQPIRELPHQQHAPIRGEALRPRLDLDRPVAFQPEQRTLNLTHGVSCGAVVGGMIRHLQPTAAQQHAPWVFRAPLSRYVMRGE